MVLVSKVNMHEVDPMQPLVPGHHWVKNVSRMYRSVDQHSIKIGTILELLETSGECIKKDVDTYNDPFIGNRGSKAKFYIIKYGHGCVVLRNLGIGTVG